MAPGAAVAANAITRQMEAVRQLEAEIASYDARYFQASAAYSTAKADLERIRGRITENTAALKKAQAEFLQAQQALASRISAVYRQPQPTQIELLLRSSSFSDAMSRLDTMERVQRQDGVVVKKIDATKQRIKATRVQLIADQADAKKKTAETRTRLGEIQSIRVARRGVLLSARRQLTVMIAVEAQRQANANRLAALRAAQRRVVSRVGGNTVQVPVPVPVATPTAPTGGAPSGDVAAKLRQIALCESGGNATAVSPSGLYRGKYQFDPQTWQANGGSGTDPAAASEAEQDAVAARLYGSRGSAPWPVCGR